MFDVCVWYKLPDTHGLSRLVRQYSSKLDTPAFDAHITIMSRLNNKQASEVVNNYKSIETPTFKVYGEPYSTYRNKFASIQVDLLENGIKTDHHVSLAYRLNKEFTRKEVSLVNIPNLRSFNIIQGSDLKIVQMDCYEFNPTYWVRM